MKLLLFSLLSIFLVHRSGPDPRIFGKTWYLRYVLKHGKKQPLPEGALENKLWTRMGTDHSFSQQSIEDGLQKGTWNWEEKTKMLHFTVGGDAPDEFDLRLKRVKADTLELEYISEGILVGMISNPKK